MMKIIKTGLLAAMVTMTTACGQMVEVGPAEVGKIMTKDGYQEGTIGTSKFRLPWCWAYCDKLVKLDVSDQKVTESMNIFMPEDKLKMDVTVQATISLSPAKTESLFGTITPVNSSGWGDDQMAMIPLLKVYQTYAQNLILTQTREYLTKYTIAEVSSSLDTINAELRDILTKELNGKTPFIIRSLGIVDIKYPNIITDAQENAAKRREQIQQEEAQLEISKVSLERELQEARLQRQIDFEKAQGEAAAQKIQREVVDERVLKLRQMENERLWIEKWDGKLPVTAMGEAIPMINMQTK